MALRALNSVVAANYNKLTSDPILAGDIVWVLPGISDTTQNPPLVSRAYRNATYTTTGRAYYIGVAADDALGTNPSGETPTMINNDAAGSNFINGTAFQSYTTGFYVGSKRAISDFKDESISVVTNLTAGVPTYAVRGITVYSTPGSQFVTDRFITTTTSSTTADAGAAAVFAPGTLLTVSVAATPGKLVEMLVANIAHGPVIGRVDYYDSSAGLLYWTLV